MNNNVNSFTVSGKIVVDLHAFVHEDQLCWLEYQVYHYDWYRRLKREYFKDAVYLPDAIVFISMTEDLEDYTPEQIVHAIATVRGDYESILTCRLD